LRLCHPGRVPACPGGAALTGATDPTWGYAPVAGQGRAAPPLGKNRLNTCYCLANQPTINRICGISFKSSSGSEVAIDTSLATAMVCSSVVKLFYTMAAVLPKKQDLRHGFMLETSTKPDPVCWHPFD
jgi:hypothetical protein